MPRIPCMAMRARAAARWPRCVPGFLANCHAAMALAMTRPVRTRSCRTVNAVFTDADCMRRPGRRADAKRLFRVFPRCARLLDRPVLRAQICTVCADDLVHRRAERIALAHREVLEE